MILVDCNLEHNGSVPRYNEMKGQGAQGRQALDM